MIFNRIWKTWESFWFHSIDLYNVSLMRMLVSVVWLIMYSLRLFDFEILYSENGVLPLRFAKEFAPEILRSPFPFYFENEMMLLASHWLFILLLFGMACGLFARSLTWLVFILHIGFLQRNPGLVYGADLFSTFWLFGLCFVKHNTYFSVWNLRRGSVAKKIALPQIDSDWVSTIGVRLIQVQLCFVYAFTGIEKLKGQTWWEGTAIWHVVNMKFLLPFDFTFLYHFPLLVAAMTVATVIFEIYFPAAMLSRSVRPYWLAIGLAFHLGIGLFMSIPFFSLVMLAPYLLFVDSKNLRLWVHRLKKS